MANQFLALALFLMLLSFFIVLNSVSSFDEVKSRPVMTSLIIAFSNRIPEKPEDPSVRPSPLVAVSDGDTLSGLEGLFKAHIANFKASRNRLGTVMHVRAEVDEFEEAIKMPGTGNYNNIAVDMQGSFVHTMITILRSDQADKPYRIDLVLNTDEDPALMQKDSADQFAKDLKQVSLFAEKLEENGLPKKMMSAGLAQGESGFIDIYFYPYQPFDVVARINDEQRASGKK